MITLTENAKDYLTDMVSKSQDTYARLSVKGGGCAGFEYKWETTDTTHKGTLIDDILVLDGMAEMFVLGCTVDYIKEFGGSYLTVSNPNAHSSCGCGTSFSIKT